MNHPNRRRHIFIEMNLKLKITFLFVVFTTLVSLPLTLEAQSASDAKMDEMNELERELGAFEDPDAVGEELGGDALRFFFLAARPVKQTFYYLEGEEYKTIQAAYNTFGHVHRISPRSKLVLYDKVTQTNEGQTKEAYVPLFTLSVGNVSDLFAVFLPVVAPATDGRVHALRMLEFSPKVFPYNQVTFMNTLPKPVAVVVGESQGVVNPGEIIRSAYTTQRKGVGYLRVALAVRDVDGESKLLYNRRIPVFKDERTLAIPIADPMGRKGIEVITHRDHGAYDR
jgi:hypothetical protein